MPLCALAFALDSAAALGPGDVTFADGAPAGAGGVAGACANATALVIKAATAIEVSVIFFIVLLQFKSEAHASCAKNESVKQWLTSGASIFLSE